MMILVDTSIWSLALRRKSADLSAREKSLTLALAELIRDGRAQLIGLVRQELLSGIREPEKFDQLRNLLHAFDDVRLDPSDYEEAAQIHNRCRSRGVAGSAIDFLICAVAVRRRWQIFTTDSDFDRYQKVLGLELYRP
ncbi:MAG: PIN domain-containing protein [Terriglobales bacterium]